jgi:hypothetical protein
VAPSSRGVQLPRAILENLDKLVFLRTAGVEHWDLEGLNPNWLKLFAQLARKSSTQALQRASAERRYPILSDEIDPCHKVVLTGVGHKP